MRTAGRDHRVELVEPLRQFPIEKTAQLDRAQSAFEKYAIRRLRLGQGKIARDGTDANKRVNGILNGFGNSRIAVAPQERIADADTNSGQVACACLRDQSVRVDTGGVECGETVGEVADAARQKPRRVESE